MVVECDGIWNICSYFIEFAGVVVGNTPIYFTWSTMSMLNNHVVGNDLFAIHYVESAFFEHFHPLFTKKMFVEKVEQIFSGSATMKGRDHKHFAVRGSIKKE